MRLFSRAPDGGKNSGVTAYFLIEWKGLFSIALLRFAKGKSRESFHSHAFNAWTWWLKGAVVEERIDLTPDGEQLSFFPSWRPKYTPRKNTHKIHAILTTWALTFRGPWENTWKEITSEGKVVVLTHGRKELQES